MAAIKVDSLTGKQLVIGVLMAMGFEPQGTGKGCVWWVRESDKTVMSDATYEPALHPDAWAFLAEKYLIGLERPSKGQAVPVWRAITDVRQIAPNSFDRVVSASASTPGEAVVKALIKSVYGDTIELVKKV